MTAPTKNYPRLLPVFSCLLAATLWGISWYPLRLLEQHGINGLWATLLIYTVEFLILFPFFVARLRYAKQNYRDCLLIAVASGWANLGFILAVLEGNVVRVLLLFYLSPVWTIIFSKLILQEKMTRLAIVSVIVAMSGALIMFAQSSHLTNLAFSNADLLAITAGMAFALMNVLLRKTGEMALILKMGFSSIGVLAISIIGLILVDIASPNFSTENLLLLFLLGSIGLILMTYSAQYGVTHLPAHRSAVLFLFEIVAGAVSAAWWANETTNWNEWLGGFAVIAAAIITAYDSLENKNPFSVSKS